MYRPSPGQLAQLFDGNKIIETSELVGDYYWVQFRKRPFTMFFRHFFRFFIPQTCVDPRLRGDDVGVCREPPSHPRQFED